MNCFVIMPFGKKDSETARRSEHIYKHWIKPAVEELPVGAELARISCHRGDTEHRPGEIIHQVIESISDADFVVADLTGKNANVFYELGVRHALRNNTILIAENIDDIPFDLRGQRAIQYRYDDPESLFDLKHRLQASLAEMISSPTRIDNPVRRFLYDREVAKLVASPVPPGYDALRQLVDEMQAVRQDLSARVTEIRTLVQNTTASVPALPVKIDQLSFFEGAWTSIEHGGLYVCRRVAGELRVPYCFGSDDEISSHLYNVQVVGQQALCRFRWLTGNLEGCVILTRVDDNHLSGGWWYIEELPKSARQDLSSLHTKLPAMNPLNLKRIPAPEPLPGWVTEYFAQVEAGRL